jgi:hypothetical protein
MGALREETTSGQLCVLEAHHLIGRSHRCSLRLNDPSVSGEHASLRWTGGAWVVKDLGSRYGTFLNSQPLQAGMTSIVSKDARLAFGRGSSIWIMTDDGPPEVMVVPVGGGPALVHSGGMIPVPSPDHPVAMVFQGKDGGWVLDQAGREEAIEEHIPFEVEGTRWRLCNASSLQPTAMPGDSRQIMNLDEVRLHFRVSLNEEHVAISARWRDRNVDLGARAHQYVLLTLARIRLADLERGEPAARAGWIAQEELLRQLHVGPEKLNLDIFRVRRQFGEHGFAPAAGIVERRPVAKELRIGVADLAIERV